MWGVIFSGLRMCISASECPTGQFLASRALPVSSGFHQPSQDLPPWTATIFSSFLFFLPEIVSAEQKAKAGNIFRGKETKDTAMKVFLCQSTSSWAHWLSVISQTSRDPFAQPPCVVPNLFWYTDVDMHTLLRKKNDCYWNTRGCCWDKLIR